MEISCRKEGVLIKSQKAELIFDHPPAINQIALAGAGEYEIGGIFTQGYSSGLYLFQIEGLKVVYFQINPANLKQNYLDDVSGADVLILDGRTDNLDLLRVVSEINRLDPRLILPFHFPNIHALVKAEGISKIETEKFKVKKGDLTEEERKLLILPCSIKTS